MGHMTHEVKPLMYPRMCSRTAQKRLNRGDLWPPMATALLDARTSFQGDRGASGSAQPLMFWSGRPKDPALAMYARPEVAGFRAVQPPGCLNRAATDLEGNDGSA
jgi:hypothetical protein